MSGHDPAAERAASARHISGMPAVEYHAMRALSASGAWLLAEECAAKFLWRSPWNPLYLPEAKTEFDIGVAAHLAVLEPARQADSIVVIEAGDYRSSKAREARDAARASGKVPLLPYQLDIVQAITGSIRAHPIASQAFLGGEAEVTLTWADPETGILFEEIEQRLDLGRVERRAVEGEVALDQAEKLGAILPFRRTNHHRASLASD